jgi:DNA modification methylase
MIEYRIGDVFERMAEIPDGSIDLIVTSPPFLALRSYLPADHPDKAKEIGSEATPAAFIDTLLALSAEWGRVLAPHGSLCVELGDTYSGSGGAGGDYNGNGLREGQQKFRQSNRGQTTNSTRYDGMAMAPINGGTGWPLAKSLTGIPTLYTWSLAYGRNLLTGQPSPAGQWRIRNLIVWARPNPPVGALGDKFRPATSYITVACRGARRYFDLDAVRTPFTDATIKSEGYGRTTDKSDLGFSGRNGDNHMTHAGAPPLDWHTDHHPEDGDWLWKMSTQPYAGSHYATFPMALPKRLIEAMCPLRVCVVCGRPSERITTTEYVKTQATSNPSARGITNGVNAPGADPTFIHGRANAVVETLGWSDCGHNNWRTGVVLDPFAGSGTTLEAAQAVGRHAIGIDLDPRNADLAQQRCGMFLTVSEGSDVA